MTHKMTVAMYLRKSRADEEKEQVGRFETLKHHEQILTEYAEKNNLTVVKIYRELASGDSIASRPEMLHLLSDVDSNLYDGVLVTELSRLARGNTADQSVVSDTFGRSNTLIITPSKTYDPTDDTDDTYIDFELFLARQEYKYIKKRMLTGRRRSAMDGNWIHSKSPFGYDTVDLKLVPNGDAEFAKYILTAYANRTERPIDLLEKAQSYPNAPKYITSLYRWMRSPIHIGYNDITTDDGIKRVKAKWDGIIDEETYQKIIDRMVQGEVKIHRYETMQNPYSGLLFCAKCGRLMNLAHNHKKNKIVKRLRHPCKWNMVDRCESVTSIKLTEFNQIMSDALERSLPEIEARVTAEDNVIDIEPLRQKVKNLEARKRLLYDLLEDGTYSPEEFRDRRAKLETDIQTINDQIEASTQVKRPTVDVVVTTKEVIQMLRDPNANVEEINTFLKSIIERIDYDRKPNEEPNIVIIPK